MNALESRRSKAVEPPRLLQGGYPPSVFPPPCGGRWEFKQQHQLLDGDDDARPPQDLNPHDPGNWPVVRLSVADLAQMQFQQSVCRATGQCEGEALWIARRDNRPDVGLAFRWALMEQDYVMPIDLPRISSNLVLMSNDGAVLDPGTHRAYWAQMVYALPWQQPALNLLKRNPRSERFVSGMSLPPPQALTKGEAECLFWCAAGKTNDDTAEIMALSPWTVKRYLTSAREKLCPGGSLPQAVCRAMDTGWLAQGMAAAAERRDL